MIPMTDALRLALDESGYRVSEDPHFAEVVGALRDDNFIEAVRQYRIATGAGLRSAKMAVEAMSAEIEANS